MNSTRSEKLEAFGRLLDILDELRVKCPWTVSRPMKVCVPIRLRKRMNFVKR